MEKDEPNKQRDAMDIEDPSKRDDVQTEYNKKLQSLQEYVPFLENMIAHLKDPKMKNREQQLAKMVSLLDMITNKKITKLDTLIKCEDVLIKLSSKVKSNERRDQNNVHEGQKFICRPPPIESKEAMEKSRAEALKFESARARLQEMKSSQSSTSRTRNVTRPLSPNYGLSSSRLQDIATPASPSPPRELFPANPIVIPTEKRVKKTVDRIDFSIGSFPVVSAVDRKLVVKELKENLPDISKPPISVEDLKILQDDEEVFQTASLEELEGMRGSIMKQLGEGKTDEDKRPPSPIKVVDLSQPDVEETSVLVVNSSVTEKVSPVKDSSKPKPTPTSPRVAEKVIKDANSIFGSTLSSIDALVLKKGKEKKKDVKKVDEPKKTEKTEKKDRKDSRSERKESTRSDRKDYKSDRKDRKESHSEKDRRDRKETSSSKPKDSRYSDKDCHTSKEKTAREEKKEERSAPKPPLKKPTTIPLISGDEAGKDEPVVKRLPNNTLRIPTVVIDMEIDDDDDEVPQTVEKNMEVEKITSIVPAPRSEETRPIDPRIKTVADTINKPIGLSSNQTDPLTTILQHIRLVPTSNPVNPEPLLPTTHQIYDKQFTTPTTAYNQPASTFNPQTNTFNQSFIPPITNHNQYQPYTQPQQQQQQQLQQQQQPQFIPPPNNCQPLQNIFPNNSNNNTIPSRTNTYVNTFIVQQNSVNQNQFGPAVNTNNQNMNMSVFPQQQQQQQQQQQPQYQSTQPKKTFHPFEPIRSDNANYSASHQNTTYGARNAAQRALPTAYDPRPFVRERKTGEPGGKDDRVPPKREDPRIRAREIREARKSVDSKEERSNSGSRYEPHFRRERNEWGRSAKDDKFMSPLDSLYVAEGPSKSVTGKGYGVQKFKIPKIKRDEKKERHDTKEPEAEVLPEKTEEEFWKIDEKKTETKDEVANMEEEPEVKQPKKADKKVKKKEAEVVETVKEPSKVEPPKEEATTKVEEPKPPVEEPKVEEKKPQQEENASKSDHAVLGEFFADLLGSTDKKNLLVTLFSTLVADSLSNQQKKKFKRIQQMVIHSDSSADEEEEKVTPVEKKLPEKKVEETLNDESEEEAQSKPERPKGKKKVSKKGGAKVAKPPEEPAPIEPLEEPATVEPPEVEVDEEDEVKDEEGAIVESVGERIKSRKRIPPPKPKRKKFRTELDLLHEDIKDMFIRDGVLTASGKRMCSILKNGSSPAESTRNENETKKQPVKEKKKPGPKKKTTTPPKKVADESEEIDEEAEEEQETRANRKKLSTNASTKLEKAKQNAKSANPCVILERMVPPVASKKALRKKSSPQQQKSDDTTTDSDAEKSQPRRNTLRRTVVKEIKYAEDESDDETVGSSAKSLSHQQQLEEPAKKEPEVEAQQGVKRKMKKPRNSWSKGVIKKKNRTSAKSDRSSDRSSPSRAETESEHEAEPPHIDTPEPTKELEQKIPLVEYYIGMQAKMFCYLCNFKGKSVVSHYRVAHPTDEVLIARVSPEVAKSCIQESQDQNYDGVQEVDLLEDKGVKKKFHFACVFCDMEAIESAEAFHDHLSTHTGEFRFCCPICTYKTHQYRALNAHVWAAHRVKNTTGPNRPAPPNYSIVFGYMCGECHYTQLQMSMVKVHMKKHQSDVRIYKVNLSRVGAKRVEIERAITPQGNVAPPVLEREIQLPLTTKPDPELEKVVIKQEKIDELSSATIIKEEPMEEVVKEKETPMDVFIGKSDDVNDEENQKIEEERKKRMEEVNSEVASRGPRLTFVDSLKTRIEQQMMMHTSPPRENIDNSEAVTPPLPPPAKRPKLAIKTEFPIESEPKDLQAKTNTPIEGTIQRLQQILPPPMTNIDELEPLSLDFEEEIVFDACFTIKKTKEKVIYACLMPTCILASDNPEVFMRHCRHAHYSSGIEPKCSLCKTEDVNFSSMEGMFRHVLTEHHHEVFKGTEMEGKNVPTKLEPMEEETSTSPAPSQPFLRARRLSGDQLSANKDETREESVVVMDENSGFPFKITSVATQQDEENQFPFAISNVMSLAADDENAMRVLKSPPPLSPLAAGTTPPLCPATKKTPTTHRVVLKDIPMSRSVPLKSPDAIATMIKSVHQLYKCPSYSCTFSTNTRSAFLEHLKTHPGYCNKGAHVPCVYCNYGNTLDHVLIHVDARHGKCCYCCSLCFYRGATHSHVKYHLLAQHGRTDALVVQVPLNQQAQNVKVPMTLLPLKTLLSDLLLDCPEVGCNHSFLTYKEFYIHFATHFDGWHGQSKTMTCPKPNCQYVAVINPNVQTVSKTKLFTHHYMREHNIKRFICRYCQTSHTQLSDSYIHVADAHSSYPVDIIEREYRPGCKLPELPFPSDTHYEQLRRIREEGPVNCCPVKRGDELKKEPTTPPQKTNKISGGGPPAVVLNSLLGLKGAKARLSAASLLDEPLVNIVEGVGVESAAVEEDPLSLENEGCVAAVRGGGGHVDSDMGSVNFDVHAVSNLSSLNEESDSMDTDFDLSSEESSPHSIRKEGYTGKQLFKCLKCDGGFENSALFKFHLNRCIEQSKLVNKPYRCFHCNKDLRSVYSLAEHTKVHGTVRYGCSLCDYKHPNNLHVRNHMKSRHSVTSVTVIPVDPRRNDPDKDEFIMRPKLKRKSIGENPQEQQTNNTSTTEDVVRGGNELNAMKLSYSPQEIDLLPRQPIYSTELRCAICNFSTKVRTNLVRHLEFHSMEKVVPTTAPVNPVPCLEKNEKMFDKMTNLALSSFANSTRTGEKSLTKEEEAQMPVFVPTTKRYVCGAIGCNYLCLDDSLLKHHLLALHCDENVYYCKHCNRDLCIDKQPINIDAITKHYKLHDLHLYKCAHCMFVHNLKHRVERHLSERHLDKEMHVIVVRKMECEPDIGGGPIGGYEKQDVPVYSMIRPWHCGMCKWRTSTREDIEVHVDNKHDIDQQYKCPLCTYKSSTKDTFTTHYAEKHPGNPIDIITAYYNADDNENKSAISKPEVPTFDTTPLWQRDKQRVRHIRGILFDESGRMPKKAPIKLQHTDTVIKMQDNLDRAIEAVVNAEDTTANEKIEALDKQIDDVLNNIVSKRIGGDEVNVDAPAEKKDDSVILIEDEGGEENEVMGTFGPFGEPLNNKFLCPLCAGFKTRNTDMIRFHLYEELQYYRYQCNVCLKKGIERKFIVRHIGRKHPTHSGDETQILSLPTHPLIEKWVEKVLEVQGRLLQKIEQKLISPIKSTTSDEQPEEQEEETATNNIDPLKKFKCAHCAYRSKYLGDVRKHERRHLSYKPLKCGHCDYEACLNNEIASHTKHRHKGLPVLVVTNTAPSTSTLPPVVRRKARKRIATLSNTTPSTDEDVDVMCVDGAANDGDDSVGSLLREKLEGNLKKYKCRICEHTSDSFMYMKQDHVRSHFKPFECPHCKKRYNYPSQVTSHINMCHPELSVDYRVLEDENEHTKDIVKRYMSELRPDGTYGDVVTKPGKRKGPPPSTETMSTSPPASKKIDFGDENGLLVVKKVTAAAKKRQVRNVAVKSTAKPGMDYGFSFYGAKPNYGDDLKKITTTFKINNADVTRTVEQFSHIFNLYPRVVVEDCMKVNQTTRDNNHST